MSNLLLFPYMYKNQPLNWVMILIWIQFSVCIVWDCWVEKTPLGRSDFLSSYYEYSQEFAAGGVLVISVHR